MSAPRHSRLIILGSGPAGYSAAVYAARANRKPLLITGIEQGGQLMTTTDVDNWPGDVAGPAGPGAHGAHAPARRALRHRDRQRSHPHASTCRSARSSSKGDSGDYTCDALIIATGAAAQVPRPAVRGEVPRPRRLGLRDLRRLLLPRPARRGRRRRQHRGRGSAVPVATSPRTSRWCTGATSCAPRRSCRTACSSGERGQDELVWNHTVDEVLGDAARRERRARCATSADGATRELESHRRVHRDRPHAQHRASSTGQLEMRDGYIKIKSGTDGDATATSVPGVFAAGDVADHVYRQADHVRRLRLHGGARCRPIPGAARRSGMKPGRSGELSRPRWRTCPPQPGMRSPGDYPFLRHEFLAALEQTRLRRPATGWIPHHLRIGTRAQPQVLAPLYEKTHSWGEFVFDFAWARAWESRGPATITRSSLLAIPFTPATGPRLLCADLGDGSASRKRLAALAAIESHARARGRSSAHACSSMSRSRAAARGRLAPAARLPLPMAQPRLRRLRGLPGELFRREAQEGAPRAPAHRRSRASNLRLAPARRSMPRCSARSISSTPPRFFATATCPI